MGSTLRPEVQIEIGLRVVSAALVDLGLDRYFVGFEAVKHSQMSGHAVGVFLAQVVISDLQHESAKSADVFLVLERCHR
jgi:hypothetical protein